MVILPLLLVVAAFASQCLHADEQNPKASAFFNASSNHNTSIINPQGSNIATRFEVPDGFTRIRVSENSFAEYLRHLPLKAAGVKVKYYNGLEKNDDAYIAVVNMDIGNQNLQQCADAVMRLRGEYFYQRKEYDSISFVLTNGFRMDYSRWMAGCRIRVTGNQTVWIKTNAPSNTYSDFRNYMNIVFSYAGTLSLSKTLQSRPLQDISIGDVFIVGGSPGHAVVVVDAA